MVASTDPRPPQEVTRVGKLLEEWEEEACGCGRSVHSGSGMSGRATVVCGFCNGGLPKGNYLVENALVVSHTEIYLIYIYIYVLFFFVYYNIYIYIDIAGFG